MEKKYNNNTRYLIFGPIKRNTRPEEETLLGLAHIEHTMRAKQPKGHFSVFLPLGLHCFARRSSRRRRRSLQKATPGVSRNYTLCILYP